MSAVPGDNARPPRPAPRAAECRREAQRLVVALLPGGCASMAPAGERYVAPPLGTTWVTVRRDTGSYGSGNMHTTGKRGERMWQGKPVIAFEGPDMTTLANPNGDWVSQVRGDTPVLTWDPPS